NGKTKRNSKAPSTHCVCSGPFDSCSFPAHFGLIRMAARSVVMSEASGRVEWSRKDAHLPTFGQKRQCPLQHDEEPVRETDQEIDVQACPDTRRRKYGEADHANIAERVHTPRDREIAFVPVPEGRRRRLSRHASSNQ